MNTQTNEAKTLGHRFLAASNRLKNKEMQGRFELLIALANEACGKHSEEQVYGITYKKMMGRSDLFRSDDAR